jgi:hypothetical protein
MKCVSAVCVSAVCVSFGTGVITSELRNALQKRQQRRKDDRIIEEIQNKISASCLTKEESIIEYETWYDYGLSFYPPGGVTWRDYYTAVFDDNLSYARKIHPKRQIDLLKTTFESQGGMAYDEIDVKVVYKVGAIKQ